MADLRNFFNKKINKKNQELNSSNDDDFKKENSSKSHVNVVLSSSDEDPLPQRKSRGRKRRAKISSDNDDVIDDQKVSYREKESIQSRKRKRAEAEPENLYDTINKVEKLNVNFIDPVSYFGVQPINAPNMPIENISVEKKSAKRSKTHKSKKLDLVVTPKAKNDSAAFLTESSEDDDFVKNAKKTASDKKEKGEARRGGFTEESKAKFLKAMQRAPPSMIGERPIPVGAKNCLEGLTFVISGILEYIEREDAESLIRRHGGRTTTGVSGVTSYLIVGREPGETKMTKAKEKNIPILNEDQLFEMISSTKPTIDEPVKISSLNKEECFIIDETIPEVSVINDKVEESLWVDKYKPKSMGEIVGQHGDKSPANKLLRWLNDWFSNRKSTEKKNFFAAKEDGSVFRAALLSGIPGVGKSTTASICSKQLGFEVYELNASDMRSKKCLDAILSVSLQNFRISENNTKTKAVLIMDEVDGMSGNEDRGGIQHLIGLIKTTNIPIICICNDRGHPKIRSLANYCYDLRFPKPRVEQIKTFLLNIAEKEHLSMDPQAAEQIVIAAHNDIRQVLNNLQMWSASKKRFGYDDSKTEASKCEKDVKENLFDVARKIFTYAITSKMSLTEKSDLFFFDYGIIPLFVFENYLLSVGRDSANKHKYLSNIAKTANSLSLGCICETQIRTYNAWSLLPTQAIFSCVIPSEYMSGVVGGMVNFPKWLGSNSTTTKNNRILQSITLHTQLKCHSSKMALNLDYLPYFHNFFHDPLVAKETEGVSEVITRVIDYDMTREDYDSIIEYSQWNLDKGSSIQTKTKSAFTRNFNKVSRQLPYSLTTTSSSKSQKVNLTGEEAGDEGDADVSSSEDGGEEKQDDDMIRPVAATPVPKKTPASKPVRKIKTK